MSSLGSHLAPLSIGIDIGGTKTHLRALPDGGGEARDLIVSSASWRRRDWDEDAEGLLALVGRCSQQSGEPGKRHAQRTAVREIDPKAVGVAPGLSRFHRITHPRPSPLH